MHVFCTKNFNFLVLVSLSVLIITATGCNKTISGKLSQTDVTDTDAHTKAELIDRLLTKSNENGKFNGVVLVSEDSKVIYKKGFGYANYEEKKPNTVQSCFRLWIPLSIPGFQQAEVSRSGN